MPSSTFSSEVRRQGAGFPWAVVIAGLLVVGVEVALHVAPAQSLLGYGEGLGTYYEVRHTIEDSGPAEVAILGSSRGRESIAMPNLREALATGTGRPVTAANYSCPDAKTNEMLLVARALTAGDMRPRVIVYIVSPRALLGEDRSASREEIFGVFPNEYGQRQATVLASVSEYPLWEVRNGLQEHWLTFRHRYRARAFMSSLPRGQVPTSPVQGEWSRRQRYGWSRSLVTHPVSEERIRAYVGRLLDEDGAYPIGDTRIAALADLMQACRDAGTELVLVAAPMSDDLVRNLPDGTMARFDAVVSSLAADHGVAYVPAQALGLHLGREDFREQSHLNRRGAEKLTERLAEDIILPRLVAQDQ